MQLTNKARLLVKNKNHFQQKNVYLREPPPGNGRPLYVFQLSDIGFMGKIFSLMVTSSHIWFISPILNVPNLKVIFLVKNSTILSKQTKSFTHLLLSFCESGGTRCPCFVFTSISTSFVWIVLVSIFYPVNKIYMLTDLQRGFFRRIKLSCIFVFN